MLRLIVVVLVVLVSYAARGAGEAPPVEWLTDFEAAVKEATNRKTLIVADFYTDWCGWCKKMDQTTFSNPAVVKLLKDYVPLKVNAEKQKPLAQRYRITGYPTVAVIHPEKVLVGLLRGYKGPDDFRRELSKVGQEEGSFLQLYKLHQDGKADAQQLQRLSVFYVDNGELDKGVALLQKIVDNDPKNVRGEADGALARLGYIFFRHEQCDRARKYLTRLHQDYAGSATHPLGMLLLAKCHQREGALDQAVALFHAFLDRYPNDPEAVNVRREVGYLEKILSGEITPRPQATPENTP
jgi:thiol-disulfide isomerase/thioredoxin